MKKIDKKAYDGNENRIESVLSSINHDIVSHNVKNIPPWIETYHLTALTYVWTVLVIIGAMLSTYSIFAVWICTFALVGHIITDAFDGALGRYRKTGLVKWGYYMDHFGDYLLSGALIVSFRLIEPQLNEHLIMFMIIIVTGYFIHSLLATVTLGRYEMTFFKLFSPLEGQIGYALLYLAVIMAGRNILLYMVPIAFIITSGGLFYLVAQTANKLWKVDMKNKLRTTRKKSK